MLKDLNCTRKQGMRLILWHGFDELDTRSVSCMLI